MYISIHRFSSKVFEALWQQLQSHLFEYDVTSLARNLSHSSVQTLSRSISLDGERPVWALAGPEDMPLFSWLCA